MSEQVSFNLQLSAELNNSLEAIAKSNATTMAEVLRHSLALLQVAHSVKEKGKHLGWVSDANRLDTEITGLL
jgi:hypothetical protein